MKSPFIGEEILREKLPYQASDVDNFLLPQL